MGIAIFKIIHMKQRISDVISELLIPVHAHFRVRVGVKCTFASAKKTPNKCRVLKKRVFRSPKIGSDIHGPLRIS